MQQTRVKKATVASVETLDGYVSEKFKGMALLNSQPEQSNGWCIVHLDSGYKLVGNLAKEEAITIAKKLATDIDFTRKRDVLFKDDAARMAVLKYEQSGREVS